MPFINFSEATLKQGQLIVPGWYAAEVISIDVKPPKSGGDSLNYVPTFRIVTKGSAFNQELMHTFNTQALGRMCPFVAAVMEKPLKEIIASLDGGELQFDTDAAIGKTIQIQIINEEYQGRQVNRVNNFAAYDAVVASF
jgi:hypothetical protein